MKNYYFANPEFIETIYGADQPVCVDSLKLRCIAAKLDMATEVLLSQMHVATESEIAAYGVYDTPMTEHDFIRLWYDARIESDRDSYVSDAALNVIWGDLWTDHLPQDRIEYVGKIWDVANAPLNDFVSRSGLKDYQFCDRFAISFVDFQSWSKNPRSIPEYVRVMLGRLLGMI